MEKRDSVKFFLRFLLLTVLTFILVVISLMLAGSQSEIGIILGAIIVIINVFFLLTFLVVAIAKLVKHIFDKKREYFDFMYVVNFLFTLLITATFMSFYFILLAAAMVILLPLLA